MPTGHDAEPHLVEHQRQVPAGDVDHPGQRWQRGEQIGQEVVELARAALRLHEHLQVVVPAQPGDRMPGGHHRDVGPESDALHDPAEQDLLANRGHHTLLDAAPPYCRLRPDRARPRPGRGCETGSHA
nr:hypothetical protein [Raineyella fluvialis]